MSNELENVLNFFNVIQPWDITWAHAVNSKSSLAGYLTDPRVQMIEGDIFWNGKENIMAHPPKTDSDLSFQDWYRGIMNSGKGAKLDFKMMESVEPCLEFAANNHDGNTPVFLNADVVKGPNCNEESIDPDFFLDICARYFPGAILSLGFCVGDTGLDEFHTRAMVEEMTGICSRWPGHATICLCSNYIRDGFNIIRDELFSKPWSFTLWNYMPVDGELAAFLLESFPREKTFYDFKSADGSPFRM